MSYFPSYVLMRTTFIDYVFIRDHTNQEAFRWRMKGNMNSNKKSAAPDAVSILSGSL